MKTEQKQSNIPQNNVEAYEKPAIETIEMENEGILCNSAELPVIPGEDW